jgi:hypothetical protein
MTLRKILLALLVTPFLALAGCSKSASTESTPSASPTPTLEALEAEAGVEVTLPAGWDSYPADNGSVGIRRTKGAFQFVFVSVDGDDLEKAFQREVDELGKDGQTVSFTGQPNTQPQRGLAAKVQSGVTREGGVGSQFILGVYKNKKVFRMVSCGPNAATRPEIKAIFDSVAKRY